MSLPNHNRWFINLTIERLRLRDLAVTGYVLVVDEADKAPTHVTAVLKTLVEDGEMLLSDGRRLVSGQIDGAEAGSSRIIPIHPVSGC